MDDAADDAAQDYMYYYGDDTYYVDETDNTDDTNDNDDEYTFTQKTKPRTTISQTRKKDSY